MILKPGKDTEREIIKTNARHIHPNVNARHKLTGIIPYLYIAIKAARGKERERDAARKRRYDFGVTMRGIVRKRFWFSKLKAVAVWKFINEDLVLDCGKTESIVKYFHVKRLE